MPNRNAPVGRGYMPKGGARAANQHNQSWRDRLDALQLESANTSTPPVEPALSHASADAAQVRASAPESVAVLPSPDGLTLGVERWLFAASGFVVGVLLPLALRVS